MSEHPSFDARAFAKLLEEAWRSKRPLRPFTETGEITSVDDAYTVQAAWESLRLAAGDRILGRKIGLTSDAMRQQFGIDEPDYGGLWASRHYEVVSGRARVPFEPYLAAKIEGEIAFHLSEPLRGPGVTAERVLGATDALAVAAEIIDSRIEDWRIRLIDTIADNASFGGFAVGPWSETWRDVDLSSLSMLVRRGGKPVAEGRGAVVLGNPANSVAWLANRLTAHGVTLEAGSVVLSGSLVAAIPIHAGDEFSIELDGQPPLGVHFEE